MKKILRPDLRIYILIALFVSALGYAVYVENIVSLAENIPDIPDTPKVLPNDQVALLATIATSYTVGGGAKGDLVRTGSISLVTTSGGNITVPADAEYVVAAFAYPYWDTANPQNVSTCTLGGQSLALKTNSTSSDGDYNTEIWVKKTPLTGSQAFVFTFKNANDGTSYVYVAFYKNVNAASDPIRTQVSNYSATGVPTTGALTTVAKDMAIGVAYAYWETGNTIPWNQGTTTSSTTNATDPRILNFNEFVCTGTTTTMSVAHSQGSQTGISVIILEN
jgi:hypothetical protein